MVIGNWLVRDCDVLIFDEPTLGIYVGARNGIYMLMNAMAEAGKPVIIISSDLPTLLRMFPGARLFTAMESRRPMDFNGNVFDRGRCPAQPFQD